MSTKMKFQSSKSSAASSLLTSHENLSTQNGCKPKNVSVFASVSRFGETKFKPIRKQENVSVAVKPAAIKRTRMEPTTTTATVQPSPVKRVNKFFKSRNGPTASGTTAEESAKSKVSPSKRRMLSTELKSIATNVSNSTPADDRSSHANRARLLKAESDDYSVYSKKSESSAMLNSRSEVASIEPSRTSNRKANSVTSSTRRTRAGRHVTFEAEEESNLADDNPRTEPSLVSNESDSNKRYSTRYSKTRNSISASEIDLEPKTMDAAPPILPPENVLNDQDITLNEADLDPNLMRENLGEIDQIDPFETSDSFVHNRSSVGSTKEPIRNTRFKGRKHVPTTHRMSPPRSSAASKLASRFTCDSDEEIETIGSSRTVPKKKIYSVPLPAPVELDVIEVTPEQEVFLDESMNYRFARPILDAGARPQTLSLPPKSAAIDMPADRHSPSIASPIDFGLSSEQVEPLNLDEASEKKLQFKCPTVSPPPQLEANVESGLETISELTATTTSTASAGSESTSNKSEVTSVPQKKRFFSRSNKDKKQSVQFNTKNFFTKPIDADLDDEFALEEQQQQQQLQQQQQQQQQSSQDADTSKEYDYLKVKRVRKAHQCAELGETEHFDGEIVFYLSGIKQRNTLSMRCLSVLGLANQCLNKTELRMHLRAHDYMSKIISALMDAPKNPNLALCAAALMFIYNQDRLTMDIDPNALSIMLELLECSSDVGQSEQIEARHMKKITEMCKTMKERGYGKYLKLNEITAGTLALETLLSLTSKRAGDWFKEELRSLKGIDFLINTVLSVTESDAKEYMHEEAQMNKIDRSLRVIENVTFMNTDNQRYVVAYKQHAFIQRCALLFEQCKHSIIYSECSSTSGAFLSPLLSILRVFTNLTSDSADGCTEIGAHLPELFQLFLDSVFELPSFVVPDSRFDLIIFLLCLCVNLVEFCEPIRREFIDNHSQLRRLVAILIERVEEAQKTEKQADDFLDSKEAQRQLNSETINIDSILTDLLAKSGKHMEHTIIAACVSLLIGCGMKDNREAMYEVKQMLPNASFDIMIDVITKLKEFSNLASIMTESGIRRVDSILSLLNGTKKEAAKDACHLDASVSLMSIKDEDLSLDDDSEIKADF